MYYLRDVYEILWNLFYALYRWYHFLFFCARQRPTGPFRVVIPKGGVAVGHLSFLEVCTNESEWYVRIYAREVWGLIMSNHETQLYMHFFSFPFLLFYILQPSPVIFLLQDVIIIAWHLSPSMWFHVHTGIIRNEFIESDADTCMQVVWRWLGSVQRFLCLVYLCMY
jgi:hypothetical protein